MARPWPRGTVLVWISIAAAVAASPAPTEANFRRVRLPVDLGRPRESDPNCPPDATFLHYADGAEGDRRIVRARTEDPASAPSPATGEPPDCRHEVAMKLLWPAIHRRDIEGMSVKPGVKYWAKLFRAAPGAPKAEVSYGVLQNLTLHLPGIHMVGSHTFEAEIHFAYKGTAGGIFDFSDDHPDFTMVVPLAFDWAWDTPRSPPLDWLTRSHYFEHPPACGWSWQGIANWFTHGLQCPTHQLLPEHLLRGSRRALHYPAGDGRGSVFVLSQALHINSRQINDVKERVEHAKASGDAEPPEEVVVGSALQPYEAFSVFSSSEMFVRRLLFELVRFSSIGAIVGAYVLVRRVVSQHALEIVDFVNDPWVQFNLKADHWFCHTAAVVIPFVSYFDGSCNFKMGMPYEYQMCLHGAFILHMAHEVLMMYQTGSTVRTIGSGRVARMALKSLLGLYHFYFQIGFFVVTLMHSSDLFWWSLATFLLGNIVGQVALFSVYVPTSLAFSARHFCVLHAVLDKRLAEMDKMDGDESKAKQRLQFQRDESFWNDSSIEGLTRCNFMVTEILQFIYQIIFVSTFGPSPIVTFSVTTSLFFLVSDMLAKIVPESIMAS